MSEVTVVIPTYNSSQTLGRCLKAPGLRLTRSHVRVIVVDNGSHDCSASLATELGAEVVSASRRGPAAARNAGLALADTEFVAFLDADCVPEQGWLERMIESIEGTNYTAAGGSFRWQSSNPYIEAFYNRHYPSNAECCSPDPPSYVLTANAIFRREELEVVGGFNSQMIWCEDLELGARLSRKGAKFAYTPEALVTIFAPDRYLDLFTQFYKYGVGLEHVLDIHPDVIDFCPLAEWQDIVTIARRTLFGRASRNDQFMLLLMRLAYLGGWFEASVRRRLGYITESQPQFLPVMHRCAAVSLAKRRIALSIDDGPSDVTPQLLSLLEQYGAKATFFVNGRRAESRQAMIEDMVRLGHEVYSHGWSHRRFDSMSTDEICDEMDRTESILSLFRRKPSPYLVRLPYGAGVEDVYVHQALRAWNPNCHIVQWSASLEDWNISKVYQSTEAVKIACINAVRQLCSEQQLAGSILLLHDMPIGVGGPFVLEISVYALQALLQFSLQRQYSLTSIGRLRSD